MGSRIMAFPRRIGFLAAAVLVAGVAACGSPMVHFDHFDIAYSGGEVSAGAGDKLLVEVIGAPTPVGDGDETALRDAVTRAMREHGPQWFRTDYTSDAAEADDRRYRLRVLFGLPLTFNLTTVCKDRWLANRAVWQQASDLMAIAFCRGQRTLSAARGSVGELDTFRADSAGFGRFLGIASRIVLPSRNPLLIDDCFDPVDCP